MEVQERKKLLDLKRKKVAKGKTYLQEAPSKLISARTKNKPSTSERPEDVVWLKELPRPGHRISKSQTWQWITSSSPPRRHAAYVLLGSNI